MQILDVLALSVCLKILTPVKAAVGALDDQLKKEWVSDLAMYTPIIESILDAFDAEPAKYGTVSSQHLNMAA